MQFKFTREINSFTNYIKYNLVFSETFSHLNAGQSFRRIVRMASLFIVTEIRTIMLCYKCLPSCEKNATRNERNTKIIILVCNEGNVIGCVSQGTGVVIPSWNTYIHDFNAGRVG